VPVTAKVTNDGGAHDDPTVAPRLDPGPLERLQRRIQVVLCEKCYERRIQPREFDPDSDSL
jgi:hypothetical protein